MPDAGRHELQAVPDPDVRPESINSVSGLRITGRSGRVGVRTKPALETVTDPFEALRAARARRELNNIEEARAAIAAADAGIAQRAIAAALGRSQADVHRLLRRARHGLPPREREIILRGVAGLESRATMVGLLKPGLARGENAPGEQADGYAPGPLDEVRRAFMEDLLTEAEYQEIRGAAMTEEPGR